MKTITLSNLCEASEQDVFEFVSNHLLIQREKSLNENLKCVYRGDKGLKCAAGCLISDEEYKPFFDNRSLVVDKGANLGFSWKELVLRLDVPNCHSSLIGNLQLIHDTFEVKEWKSKLINLGIERNLGINFLEKY